MVEPEDSDLHQVVEVPPLLAETKHLVEGIFVQFDEDLGADYSQKLRVVLVAMFGNELSAGLGDLVVGVVPQIFVVVQQLQHFLGH